MNVTNETKFVLEISDLLDSLEVNIILILNLSLTFIEW